MVRKRLLRQVEKETDSRLQDTHTKKEALPPTGSQTSHLTDKNTTFQSWGLSAKSCMEFAGYHLPQWGASAGAWFMVLCVYLRTRYAGIPGGDSGELVGVACQGGVVHPPGYPLYTMLIRVFMMLPTASTPHQRASALSALATTGAGALLFAAARRISPHASAWSAMGSAGLYCFSPLVWSHATQPEVFALNNLLAAGLLLLVTMWYDDAGTQKGARNLTADMALNHSRVAKVAAFVAGLALSNQHTIALFLLPVGLCALWSGRRHLSPELLLSCLGLGAAGMTPYLYLLVVSSPPKQFAWGDTSTVGGLIKHMLRREYGSFSMTNVARMQDQRSRGMQLVRRLKLYFLDLSYKQGFYVLPLLAAVGWCFASTASARRRGTGNLHSALLAAWACYLLAFHLLANIDLDRALFVTVMSRFWQQPNMLVFAYVGPGLHQVVRVLKAAEVVEPVAAMSLLALQVALNYPSLDRSDSDVIGAFARDVLTPLPKHSLLLVLGEENLYPLVYTQSCERLRPDVRIVSKEMSSIDWYVRHQSAHLPGVVFPGRRLASRARHAAPGSYLMAEFLTRNLAERAVYVLGGAYANFLENQLGEPSLGAAPLTAWPEGLSERVYLAAEHPSVDAIYQRHMKTMQSLGLKNASFRSDDREDTWEWLVLDALWQGFYRIGWHMSQYGIRRGGAHKWETVQPGADGANRRPVQQGAWTKALHHALSAYQILQAQHQGQINLDRTSNKLPLDFSFDGYIYKNSGFIHQTLQNVTAMQNNYQMFLTFHRTGKDPNLDIVRKYASMKTAH